MKALSLPPGIYDEIAAVLTSAFDKFCGRAVSA